MTSENGESTSLSLLNRVRSHDQDAWVQFTRLYGPMVFAWVHNSGLQPHDADDVVQDVFRVVSQKLKTYERGRKESGAFRSWLWGITRKQVLSHLRSVKRQAVGDGGTDAQISLQRLEATENEPESVDGRTVEQILLQSAIEILKPEFDPRTWRAFHDLAVKGRPAGEIGEELQMTAKAVRQAKFRVAKKLRDLLEDSFPEIVRQYSKPQA